MIIHNLDQSAMSGNSYGDNESILASDSNVSETLLKFPSVQSNKLDDIGEFLISVQILSNCISMMYIIMK